MGMIAGVIVFGGLLSKQITAFASAPFLSITSARQAGSQSFVAKGSSFAVTGRTISDATVLVNGDPVPVTDDGSFSQSVPVQKGVNAVVVEARTNKGRTSTETLSVLVP
jgi:hypothetical protein